jgi:hypothetical protein
MLPSVPNCVIRAVVDAFTQIFAWLEVGNVFAGEGYGLAGLRIAALTRWAEVQREAAEPTDFDAAALGQCIAHDLKDLLDGQLDVLGGQMLLLGCNELDEFRFRHVGPLLFLPRPKAVGTR